jgi:hypothetical protein
VRARGAGGSRGREEPPVLIAARIVAPATIGAAGRQVCYACGMRETLMASMGPIELSDLRPHLVRDAVIVVDASLDLLDVGEAVARDDKERVSAWLAAGLLAKPSTAQIERWSTLEGPAWTALVVQPFVLLREGLLAQSPSA